MTDAPNIPANWSEMTTPAKAQHLLNAGVVAKIDIDDEELVPKFSAFSSGCKLEAAGLHETEEEAIKAGIEWLKNLI